ncbi:MAG TPA: hypothetical protein VNW15_03745 [Rhizomicrobium sp.]|jgi:hypothetical protein|nr:hypothetical protein [Rhizomicrobium sp.]
MGLAKKVVQLASSRKTGMPAEAFALLSTPIDDLLASGGDQRLVISPSSGQNMYGCTPYPRPELIDFASSTASSISSEAHAHVLKSHADYLVRVISNGAASAFETSIFDTRQMLLELLGLKDIGAEILFAASGTDAQLNTLFIVKNLLGLPLTTIVAGADQTGSGTAFTSRGRHFSHVTSGGHTVEKDRPIDGLAEGVDCINVPFRGANGFRTEAEMDAAVTEAVEAAIGRGSKILLQTMDSSKFGWRAPSDSCIDRLIQRWPDHLQIVVDACQMRLDQDRIRNFLLKGFMVLITGSKFFTGPAFSGAVIVPGMFSGRINSICQVPPGLSAYTSAYDWPEKWEALRSRFPARANPGQWLRWEASIEEMRMYYAIPPADRENIRAKLAGQIRQLVEASPCLRHLQQDASGRTPDRGVTMFPILPYKDGAPLSPDKCALLYKALRGNLAGLNPAATQDTDSRVAHLPCQAGQPVFLSEKEGAALRVSISARTIRQCWSPDPGIAAENLRRAIGDIGSLIEKINFVVRNIEIIVAKQP